MKGYEVTKGNYVMVEPDELAEFNPRATRTIDIEDFVALDDIDPIYYDATYYLAPEKSDGRPEGLRPAPARRWRTRGRSPSAGW